MAVPGILEREPFAPGGWVHGVIEPSLNDELIAVSGLDRSMMRAARAADPLVPARITGGFQWLVGRAPGTARREDA